MSSDAAMSKHGSRKDGYRGAEGKLVSIPYKGPVEDTVTEIPRDGSPAEKEQCISMQRLPCRLLVQQRQVISLC